MFWQYLSPLFEFTNSISLANMERPSWFNENKKRPLRRISHISSSENLHESARLLKIHIMLQISQEHLLFLVCPLLGQMSREERCKTGPFSGSVANMLEL